MERDHSRSLPMDGIALSDVHQAIDLANIHVPQWLAAHMQNSSAESDSIQLQKVRYNAGKL